uniref:Ycf34 n=1 Tax=Izziella formosana TaxID=1653389 RepID=A0A1G4NV21_9FLOR|nr:Hypothetical protein ycf34 [Izziella formosana]SCW22339.1 Hypothetical protein ycf34 [Izziella formosana]
MCICINCIYVHECSTYELITRQHHKNYRDKKQNSLFDPYNPILNVNYIQINNKIHLDWDVIECLSFIEKPGYWQQSF